VTFDHVPWFIICVRLGPSTPGDYVRARVLVPLKPGCDRSGIRGMFTVGRNLDRNGHNHYLLILLWFFLYLSWSCLIFYCSTLINHTFATLILSELTLIFSHLFPLHFDYSYLFFQKANMDFTLSKAYALSDL
jgi:hypothetical protein